MTRIPPVATQPALRCNLHWATRTSARADCLQLSSRLLSASEANSVLDGRSTATPTLSDKRRRRDSFRWPVGDGTHCAEVRVKGLKHQPRLKGDT